MKTQKINTRFMQGNGDVDGIIFDILVENYGLGKVLESNFDTDNAIYSDGFINAIEKGLIPSLELNNTNSHNFYNENKEYHHVIINNECYNVYFNN